MKYNGKSRIEAIYGIMYKNGEYIAPPVDLLENYTCDEIFLNEDRVRNLARTLQITCEGYGLSVRVVDYNATNVAITFTLELMVGTNIKSVLKLKTEFEVFLGSNIEINAYGVGSNMVQISVKNSKRPLIGLKDILTSDQFENSMSPLSIAAGIDVQGNPLVIDIENAPHMLIAGTTGSGKSVFIDDIILSIIYNSKPEDVRLLLIDPKVVELSPYNGIPHLLMPVISDTDSTLSSFMWVEDEMLKRYDMFSEMGVKYISEYNKISMAKTGEKLPRILVIVDEYVDLMLDSPKEVDTLVDRIARLGRAAGIHLILATQLPVAKIVTTHIKANIPCRASFTVIDGVESRAILDKTGAERLLGSGDMIFTQPNSQESIHAQAAYVSETELNRVIDYIRHNN